MYKLLFSLGLLTSTVVSGDTLVLSTAAGPPLTTPDQRGFVDQVVAEGLTRMGHNLMVVHLPAERALLNANTGVDDGDLIRIGGLEKSYPNLIQIKENIFTMEFVAFSRTLDFPTTDWNSLRPYTVGIITGWKILERNLPPEVAVTKVKNAEQLFTLLQNGRADVILYSKWQGLSYAHSQHLKGIRLLQPDLAKTEMYVYFNTKRQTLVDDFSQQLRAIKADGTYQRIYNKTILPLTLQAH